MRMKGQMIASLLIFFLCNCMIFAEESGFRKEELNQHFPAGKQLKIIRKDNSTLKGKLIRFTETAVVISAKSEQIEVPYNDIKKIEKSHNAGGLIIGISAISVLILLPFLFGS